MKPWAPVAVLIFFIFGAAVLLIPRPPSATAGGLGVADGFDYPVGTPQRLGGTGYVTQQLDGDGWYNSQDFGENGHLGEDWNGEGGGDTDLGEPVFAVANGEVVYAQNGGVGWSNVVVIRHELPNGTSVTSMYTHLRSFLVSTAVIVEKGQKIGEIGKDYPDRACQANGAYCAHLHFEIRTDVTLPIPGVGYTATNAGWVDPSDFINDHRSIGVQDKALVQAEGAIEVHWLQNGTLYHVVSADILNAMQDAGVPGWGWDKIITVSQEELNGYTSGPELIAPDSSSDGILLRRWTQEAGPTDVFLVHDGKDRHIKNPTAFAQYGFNWDDVIDVAPGVLDLLVDGETIYAVGQLDPSQEDVRQEFVNGWLALLVKDRNKLGYAREWVKDDGAASPVPPHLAGSRQSFDEGALQLRNGDAKAYAVRGGMWKCWKGEECDLGGAAYSGSWLGWPISNEYDWEDGRRQDFEGGYIYWTAAEGATPYAYGEGLEATPTPTPTIPVSPTPSPTPTLVTPTPTPNSRCLYDANDSGFVERQEAVEAVTDYLLGRTDIGRDEAIDVVTAYLLEQSFTCT